MRESEPVGCVQGGVLLRGSTMHRQGATACMLLTCTRIKHALQISRRASPAHGRGVT